jgi:predicted nucleotidyltransferase
VADLTPFALDNRTGKYILVGQVGSKAYGTDTPESDDDWMGVALAPMSHYIGLRNWENDGTLKIDRKETLNAELTAYELKKFLRLMIAYNPNVVPLLYLRETDYELIDPAGHLLITQRKKFESKRACKTLIGYAEGQIKGVINCNTGKLGRKRKELVAKYGYDTKFAAHTIRILNMAIEFFDTGELNVYRTWDRDTLMEIRNGEWKLEEWLSYTKYRVEVARQAESRTSLPDQPDMDFINDLCMHLIEFYGYYD